MPTPASPVCLVLGRLPSPWPIRLWAPTGGTWGQQYARAGRRSQCVTHTQHRGRSDTLTPSHVPAGGKHAHTSKKVWLAPTLLACLQRCHPRIRGSAILPCPAGIRTNALVRVLTSDFIASQLGHLRILGDQPAEAGYIGPLFALPRGRGPRRDPACPAAPSSPHQPSSRGSSQPCSPGGDPGTSRASHGAAQPSDLPW